MGCVRAPLAPLLRLPHSSLSFESRDEWSLSHGGWLQLSLLFQQARSWLGLLDVNQKPFASEARFESGPAGFSHPLFAQSY